MEDLKEYLERDIDETMKKLGFTRISDFTEQDRRDSPISGTVTFLKGESAKRIIKGIYGGKRQEE